MTEPIHPLRRASDARRPRRRVSDRAAPEAAVAEDRSVPVSLEADRPVEPPPLKPSAEATYAAHLLGQKEARRGLRGGPEVLGAAQAAYLGAEYSGQADRRPVKGIMRKTEI